MTAIKFMYLANIVVAGWISITSLFFPKAAQRSIFTDAFEYSEALRLVGALWFAIFALSVLGLFFPKQMSLVLVFQLGRELETTHHILPQPASQQQRAFSDHDNLELHIH